MEQIKPLLEATQWMTSQFSYKHVSHSREYPQHQFLSNNMYKQICLHDFIKLFLYLASAAIDVQSDCRWIPDGKTFTQHCFVYFESKNRGWNQFIPFRENAILFKLIYKKQKSMFNYGGKHEIIYIHIWLITRTAFVLCIIRRRPELLFIWIYE